MAHLGVVADVVPPRRVEDVVALHDLLEHFRLVVRVERLVAAQTAEHRVQAELLASRIRSIRQSINQGFFIVA